MEGYIELSTVPKNANQYLKQALELENVVSPCLRVRGGVKVAYQT